VYYFVRFKGVALTPRFLFAVSNTLVTCRTNFGNYLKKSPSTFNLNYIVRFRVLTVVIIKIMAFWE
jgi:hypothetical protein